MKIVDYRTYLLFIISHSPSSRLHDSTSRLHVSTSRLHQPAGSAIKVYPNLNIFKSYKYVLNINTEESNRLYSQENERGHITS